MGQGARAGLTPAGFGRRSAAYLVDALLLAVPAGGIGKLAIEAGTGPVLFTAIGSVLVALSIAYFVILDGGWRATVGKRALGIEVVDAETGEAVGYRRGLIRTFAAALSAIPFGAGYIRAADDPRGRTWHDRLAGSVVIKSEPKRARPPG